MFSLLLVLLLSPTSGFSPQCSWISRNHVQLYSVPSLCGELFIMEQFCLNMASGVVHYKPSLGCVLFGLVQQTLGHSHEPFLTSTSKSGNKGPLSSSHCLLPRDAIDSSCSSALDFYLKLHCLKKKKKHNTKSRNMCQVTQRSPL